MQKLFHIGWGERGKQGLAKHQQHVHNGLRRLQCCHDTSVTLLQTLRCLQFTSTQKDIWFAASSSPNTPAMPCSIVRSLHNSNVFLITQHNEHWISNYTTPKTFYPPDLLTCPLKTHSLSQYPIQSPS